MRGKGDETNRGERRERVRTLSDLHPYGADGYRYLWETGARIAGAALSPVRGSVGRSHGSTGGRSRITATVLLGLALGAIARYSVFRLVPR